MLFDDSVRNLELWGNGLCGLTGLVLQKKKKYESFPIFLPCCDKAYILSK